MAALFLKTSIFDKKSGPYKNLYKSHLKISRHPGNGSISVMGTVKFSSPTRILPSSSCVTINLRDVTLQDIPSQPLATTKIDASGLNISDGILFKLTSSKPVKEHLNRRWVGLNKVFVLIFKVEKKLKGPVKNFR